VDGDGGARAAYEAFVSAMGGAPRWEELDERERRAWRASAAAAHAPVSPAGEAKPRAVPRGHGRVTRFDEGKE
jgi:hypothetical protein